MNQFRTHLFEARKRARLTQKELAEKIDVHDTYISKMERGTESPPSRRVAVKLADALGMSNKPVTLYVSEKDRDALQRFMFLLKANAAGAEDVQEIRLAEFEENVPDDGEEQEDDTSTYSMVNSAIGIPDSLFGTIGEQIKEIEHLVNSLSLTDDEEDMVASQLDTTKRLLKFIATQRKTRKEG